MVELQAELRASTLEAKREIAGMQRASAWRSAQAQQLSLRLKAQRDMNPGLLAPLAPVGCPNAHFELLDERHFSSAVGGVPGPRPVSLCPARLHDSLRGGCTAAPWRQQLLSGKSYLLAGTQGQGPSPTFRGHGSVADAKESAVIFHYAQWLAETVDLKPEVMDVGFEVSARDGA